MSKAGIYIAAILVSISVGGVISLVVMMFRDISQRQAEIEAAVARRELVRICAGGSYIYRDKETGRLYAPWAEFAKDISIEQTCAK